MSCASLQCKSPDSRDRVISCCVCANVWHLKCASLTAKNLEAVNDNNKGLRWFCINCRQIDIEFLKLIKSLTDELNDIDTDVLALASRVSNFKKKLSSCPQLDLITTPPFERNETTSSVLTIPTFTNMQLHQDQNDLIELNLNSPSAACSTAAKSNSNPVRSENDVNINVPSSGNQLTSNSSLNDSSLGLRVIPARKSVFVSRFASDTSADEILNFVKSKVGFATDVDCRKLGTVHNRAASFKLVMSSELFDRIVDYNFWPPNVFVKEFVYYDRPRNNIVERPKVVLPASKN